MKRSKGSFTGRFTISLVRMKNILLCYLLVLNIGTFALFGMDKWKAVHRKWRIREAVLLGCSMFGGAAGGLLAMYLFRHKTHKARFRIGVPVMLAVQVIIAVCIKICWKTLI